jgi:hypothetical protein
MAGVWLNNQTIHDVFVEKQKRTHLVLLNQRHGVSQEYQTAGKKKIIIIKTK